MSDSANGTVENAAAARRAFADMIDGLTDEQLEQPTLCDQWTPRHVAGHLASFVEMSLPTMMLSMAKAGFNIDKAWKANASKYSAPPIGEVTAALRTHAAKPAPMKAFPPGLTTTDVAVHTQDVRRPLGLEGSLDPDVLREALEFSTASPKRKILLDPKRTEGLRFEATDLDWSHGEGDLVSGPGEAILLAIHRRDTFDELAGEGVDRLRT
ncbi:MAG: maleylpyruvate isomerase family mycothiol-dependent enzyme [Ilumatobacter sp.]|nr:maleylpyruvate isomerase family mycothiol-dependent enzyme [Ilumatobacter sp.]